MTDTQHLDDTACEAAADRTRGYLDGFRGRAQSRPTFRHPVSYALGRSEGERDQAALRSENPGTESVERDGLADGTPVKCS